MSSYYYSDTGSAIVKDLDHHEPRQLRYYSFFTALSQIFGFLMLFFTGYWNGSYNGGYQWGANYTETLPDGTPNKVFVTGNWHYHATFMTYGLVFLQGEAILMYRLFRHERKIFSKFLHGLFHLFAFVLLIFGLIAIVQHKNNMNNKHMFSAHSWVGVSIIIAYTLQFVAGFINFGFPKTSPAVRAWYLPIHRAVGLIIFALSCAQAVFGVMQETWILTARSGGNYFGRVGVHSKISNLSLVRITFGFIGRLDTHFKLTSCLLLQSTFYRTKMTSTYYYSDASSLIKEHEDHEPRQLRYYSFFTALSQIFGFLMLFFTGYWNGSYNGGYQWGANYTEILSGGVPNKVFVTGNWHYHATFMTYGLVFLQGEAILMYRLFRHERKIFSKFLHGLFHLFALVLFVFGLIAIVTHKNNMKSKHMFSAHSWIGVSVIVGFILQYICGFVSFGFPKVSPAVRAWYLPVHRAVGLVIFSVSCVQAVIGNVTETWILYFTSPGSYFQKCYGLLDCHGQGFIINFNLLFLILYAITVVYLTTSKKYKRAPTIDEQK
uniref:Cytochrome b561 domain-containing protein n=1 Tax=Plectus sambesii TaxID=2011161 RepID=A0A914VV05_9BILA